LDVAPFRGLKKHSRDERKWENMPKYKFGGIDGNSLTLVNAEKFLSLPGGYVKKGNWIMTLVQDQYLVEFEYEFLGNIVVPFATLQEAFNFIALGQCEYGYEGNSHD